MIFVTAGTRGSDDIVKRVDEIASKSKEEFLVVVGEGTYIPQNCKWVKSVTSIVPYVKKSKLVITHGGAGTLFECLHNNARIIAIAKRHTDDHQIDIVNKLSNDGYIIKCDSLEDLKGHILSNKRLKHYVRPKCFISNVIKKFLKLK